MRLARIAGPAGPRPAIVVADRAHPLPPETDILSLAMSRSATDDILAVCEPAVPVVGECLLTPFDPGTFRDFMTFEQHVEGVGRAFGSNGAIEPAWYEIPAFYFSNPHSFHGPADPVAVPPGCERFDFELEVGAVIGRDGFNLSVDEAAEVIAGYTIINDWSARDLQRHEMAVHLGPAKGKDSATTIGPHLVTPDELEDRLRDGRLDLAVSASVNGDLIGTDTLANMAWSFAEMISYASRGTWVRAGDLFGSGTTGGGCLAEWWGRLGPDAHQPLAVGDIVTLRVDRLGTLRTTVVEGVAAHPLGTARRVPPERWSATT